MEQFKPVSELICTHVTEITFILYSQWYTGYFVYALTHQCPCRWIHIACYFNGPPAVAEHSEINVGHFFRHSKNAVASKADPRRIPLEQFLYLFPTLMQQWLLALRCYKSGWLAMPNPPAQRCYILRSHSVFINHKKNLGKSSKPSPSSEKNQLWLFFVCLF